MQLKRLRRNLRKRVKVGQQQVEDLGKTAEKGLERNLFRRFTHLKPVRRFMIGWIALMFLLIAVSVAQFQHLTAYYQKLEPVPGGIYSEGVVGSISNTNPIYASSEVDRSLSRLLFAGLLTYDAEGELIGGLARNYAISENGKVYTVQLQRDLTWHDGKPITSKDVVFTYNTIKDPDARSPLLNSWKNVTIAAVDAYTITFTLPSTLASFPGNLTTGIIPEHILGNVGTSNLRSVDFNTVAPVGSGPFKWHGLQVSGNDPSSIEEQVALLPFDNYVLGKPKLGEFIVHSYATQERLQKAFESGQLNAAASLNEQPAKSPKTTESRHLVMAAGNYVFFKTSSESLSSVKTRQALVAASNPQSIIDSLNYTTRPVTGPLLVGQLGYDKKYAQNSGDPVRAKQLLLEDGWVAAADGMLSKNGKPLRFSLVATDTPEYRKVTKQLEAQWKAVGVRVSVQLIPVADYASVLAAHDYDATLYGIAVGDDPDVYAYWDSSQADVRSDSRLNLSEWKNSGADAALEAGRTRLDPQIRTVKYAPFLQAWQQESPALGLYQPAYLYITRGPLYGLTERTINSSIDRYNGVQNWQIRTARVTHN